MSYTVNVEVEVRNNDVERALKQFTRKVYKLGVLEEYKRSLVYEKPSVKRSRIKQRMKREHARRRAAGELENK